MPNFWEEFNKTDSTFDKNHESIKTLPFFHSCDLPGFENIMNTGKILPRKDEEDDFYAKKKVFCYYGKPLYNKADWNAPYILGLKFKTEKEKPDIDSEKISKPSISPTDTGMLSSLKKIEDLKISKYLKENDPVILFTSDMEVEYSEILIKKYIKQWFLNNKSYCRSELLEMNDDEDIRSAVCRTFKKQILELNDSLDKFKKDFIKENGLYYLNDRKFCIEFAFDDQIDLKDCELLHASIPKDVNTKDHRNFLIKTFGIDEGMIDKKVNEYPLRREHRISQTKIAKSIRFSLDKLILNCIQEFQKEFDLWE